MKLTVQQELALKEPYTDADAKDLEHEGVSVHHMSARWISSDVQVHVIFTVSIPNGEPPFWHVSMGVKVRDVGSVYVKGTDMAMRRRLREIGVDVLEGVGEGPDMWDIGDKALHLMRALSAEEIEIMGALGAGPR